MTIKAQNLIREIFDAYMIDLSLLPENEQQRISQDDPWLYFGTGKNRKARVIADYIAGMTDRFAIAEHERIIQRDQRS